jgi:hypothetical protein
MRSRCCVCVYVCVCVSPLSLLGNGSVKIPLSFLSNGLDKNPPIVARQWLGKSLLIVARQRLGRNLTALTNTHATIEELLEASFLEWPVSHEGIYAISSFRTSSVMRYIFVG